MLSSTYFLLDQGAEWRDWNTEYGHLSYRVVSASGEPEDWYGEEEDKEEHVTAVLGALVFLVLNIFENAGDQKEEEEHPS